MSIVVVLIVAGIVSGLARGGKLENLANIEFRWPLLVFGGLGLQVGAELAAVTILPGLGESGWGTASLGLSYLLIFGFVIANRALPGIWLITAGIAMNFLVITINGGMPVSSAAASSLGVDLDTAALGSIKHLRMTSDTLLPFLGDVLPIPILSSAVSAGDLTLGAGVFVMLNRLIRYKPRRLLRKSGA